MKRQLFVYVLAALLLVLGAAACAAPAAAPAQQPAAPAAATEAPMATEAPAAAAGGEKTLVVALGADPTGLDPETVMNNESGFVMSTIYDGIVNYKPGTSEVAPGLAESWDVSPDGTEYTFHLRQGVTFHDGTPFNADALVAELDRILNESNMNYIFNQEGIHSFAHFTFGLVTSYEAIDDNTVKITLSEAHAPFLASLAMAWTGIVSPAAVEEYGAGLPQHPVGTGPFKFVEWVRNDHVTLEANEDYWGGKPKVDRLIFQVVPDSSVRLLKLEQGEVHIMADVNPDDLGRIRDNSDLVLLEQPGLTINGVRLPNNTPPFDDPRVRQAVNYAVNKGEMNEFLYKSIAVTMKSPIPPVMWGYNDQLEGYPYDPEKAKQLLADAGYPDGFDAELLIYDNPRGYNPVGGRMGVAIQEYLNEVGVNTTIQQLEWGAFLDRVRSGEYHGMALGGWSGDNGDPDNFLYELFSSYTIPVGNTAAYRNDELDQILVEARQTTDHEKRVELYKEAQRIIVEDAPWIFVNHTKQIRATRKEVQGFQLNPLQMFFHMENVSLEQ